MTDASQTSRRLLVTGGTGYLGRRVVELAAAGWDVTWTAFRSAPDRTLPGDGRRIDLRDATAVARLMADVRPAAVIHTACANRTAEDIAAIVPAARAVAEAARTVGARVVHVSSDMVFDGRQPPYADDAPHRPLSPYGRAKSESEHLVLERTPASVVARTSLIWSIDPVDRATRWLVDGLARGEEVVLFTDEVRCPVWRDTLAAALVELAQRPAITGPLNVAGAQPLSRLAFGKRLLDLLEITPGPTLHAGRQAEHGAADRPSDVTLDIRRATRLLETPLLGVDEVIRGPLGREPG